MCAPYTFIDNGVVKVRSHCMCRQKVAVRLFCVRPSKFGYLYRGRNMLCGKKGISGYIWQGISGGWRGLRRGLGVFGKGIFGGRQGLCRESGPLVCEQ